MMYTFNLATPDNADEKAKPILTQIQGKFGMLPNFFGALGLDGVSLEAFMALQSKLEQSKFSKRDQEMLALAVANYNGCHYCVSAHTFSAKRMAGMNEEECREAQHGRAKDPREQVIIDIALAILKNHGQLDKELLARAKAEGFTEADIVQLTLLTALNSFTNWLNNVVDPKIDFPEVPLV